MQLRKAIPQLEALHKEGEVWSEENQPVHLYPYFPVGYYSIHWLHLSN